MAQWYATPNPHQRQLHALQLPEPDPVVQLHRPHATEKGHEVVGRGETEGSQRHDIRILQCLQLELQHEGEHQALWYVHTQPQAFRRQGGGHPPRPDSGSELHLCARLRHVALRILCHIPEDRRQRQCLAGGIFALFRSPLRPSGERQDRLHRREPAEQRGDEDQVRQRHHGNTQAQHHRQLRTEHVLQHGHRLPSAERPDHGHPTEVVEELHLQHEGGLRDLCLRARRERQALCRQPYGVWLRTIRTLPGYVAELLVHPEPREVQEMVRTQQID